MPRSLLFAACLLATAALAPPPGAAQVPDAIAVINEMNLARTKPAEYATYLEQMLPHFDGSILRMPGEVGIQTDEGPAALREAIDFLKRVRPVPSLDPAQPLMFAARDHVQDQGPRGGLGHRGNDGSTMAKRIERYATWIGSISENIDYGSHSARRVVISLIVDDGIPDRGHRENIFQTSARLVGAACGPHRTYRTMCVIDYAGGLSAPDR